jgi:hypothetical protein
MIGADNCVFVYLKTPTATVECALGVQFEVGAFPEPKL